MPHGQLCLGFVPGPESNNNCFVEIFSEGTIIGSVLSRVGTMVSAMPPLPIMYPGFNSGLSSNTLMLLMIDLCHCSCLNIWEYPWSLVVLWLEW